MRAGVDAGVALVMTGHVEMPAVGATGQSSALSKAVVTDLLRGAGRDGCNGLNFQGVAVSDSFVMAPVLNAYGPAEAAWRGLAAGLDLVLMPQDPAAAVSGIVGAVSDGSLDRGAADGGRDQGLRAPAGAGPIAPARPGRGEFRRAPGHRRPGAAGGLSRLPRLLVQRSATASPSRNGVTTTEPSRPATRQT